MSRRGEARYDRQPDFFHCDLIEAYVAARQRLGGAFIERQQFEAGLLELRRAWSMKWLMPEIPTLAGFALYRLGRLEDAAGVYRIAVGQWDALIELGRAYRALEPLLRKLRSSAAEAHVNLGVVVEKLGDRRQAAEHYRGAVALKPDYDQAHYNLAVLEWGADWDAVIRELEAVLRINPGHAEAARYLPIARAKRQRPCGDFLVGP